MKPSKKVIQDAAGAILNLRPWHFPPIKIRAEHLSFGSCFVFVKIQRFSQKNLIIFVMSFIPLYAILYVQGDLHIDRELFSVLPALSPAASDA